MRLNEKNVESLALVTEAPSSEPASMLVDHRSYHELEDQTVLEVDVLTQFKTNLQVLTDLTSRLAFLNREIRYVMRVD